MNGFRNQTQGQSLSPLLIEAYSSAAERLARSAFQGGDTHKLIPCKPSVPCRARFVREFGLKAFRRPLDAGEQKRYEALMAKDPDFLKGAQLVLETMLQSPNFIFRLDATGDAKLKPWATANRLPIRFGTRCRTRNCLPPPDVANSPLPQVSKNPPGACWRTPAPKKH